MGDQAELFDTSGLPTGGIDRYVTDDMGHDAKRTARRRAMIEDGCHPATFTATTDQGTCGECAALVRKRVPSWDGRHVWKCRFAQNALNDGPDIVRAWPSCIYWTQRKDTT